MKKTQDELLNMLTPEKPNEKQPILMRFAFMKKDDSFYEELAELAEKENWSSNHQKPLNILKNYITYTFEKIFNEGEILFSDSDEQYACFNTGLLTENGEDILCLFNRFKNSDTFQWHIMGARQESHRDVMNNFSESPKVAVYFSNPSDAYFNPNLDMLSNIDHIINDNMVRFPTELQEKGAKYIIALLKSSLDVTLKKCKRNHRIAVPQYYKNEIMYLLPVELDGNKLALAVQYINGRYRANTIFTLEMAYKNARLLMKPEADWLEI